MNISAHGETHTGLVRSENEDGFYCGRQVFAVADGLGGHAAGEIASRLVIAALAEFDRADVACQDMPTALRRAIDRANQRLLTDAVAHPEREGMGTTVTALAVCEREAHVAHVGDSRCYLLRRREGLRQVTTDHTVVAEAVATGALTWDQAEVHPARGILSRVLGVDAVHVDLYGPFVLDPGDRMLVCSDGLTAVLDDGELTRILLSAATPKEACGQLVRATLDSGAPDNVTVVVVDAVDG
jgi:PPM family protein phosphatase